jgi:mycothiol synthase
VPGLALRSYAGTQDIPAIAAIFNAEHAADGIPEWILEDDLRSDYANPNEHFDPDRDVVVGEVDGQPVAVAVANWIDTNDGELREHRLFGAVHPDWRRRGIGSVMFADNERRARELAQTHRTQRQRVVATFSGERQYGLHALTDARGYERVRYFFDMIRPHLDDVPDVALPAGLAIRSTRPEDHQRVWDALVEAFRDHWGGFDDSPQAFRRWVESPHFEPELQVIAYDGEEVAGGVVNGIAREENERLEVQRGWLHQVFTRRPWRRRGLARALIARSLVMLREHGMREAALGVDAENPSGALGLYEDLGFAVAERYTAHRKRLTLDGEAAHDARPTRTNGDDRDE